PLPTPVPTRPSRWFARRLARGALYSLFTLVALAIIGAVYQAVATARDARVYAPPGQRVDVGEHRLHLHCTGPTESGKPTVILETGLGGTSSTWAWIAPEVARMTLVCAYDRAGMGWSDLATEPRDAGRIAEELRTLLRN